MKVNVPEARPCSAPIAVGQCETSADEVSIFRAEAIAAREKEALGEVLIATPVSFFVTSIGAAILGLSIVTFFCVATYTSRTTVSGQLVPENGLITVYPQQTGTVIEKRVSQGQRVRQGEVLYVVSSERNSSTQGGTQATISSLVAARLNSLLKDMQENKRLEDDEQITLRKKIKSLQASIVGLDNILGQERHQLELVEDESSRYQELLASHFVSQDAAQQRQAGLLEQETRLSASERDRIAAIRELDTATHDLRSSQIKGAQSVEQTQREIDSAEQELTESEAKRENIIKAPRSGIVTVTIAEVGQTLDVNKPVASILGDNAVLEAALYVTSSEIGFVKPGDSVLLRYRAYPYQKFGSFEGTVSAVSITPLASQELNSVANFTPKSGEPLYKISVRPNEQRIFVGGRAQGLQIGMLLDADMLQDTRRLYEWILEPLYAISSRVKTPRTSP
jgi:membrane fusion protein